MPAHYLAFAVPFFLFFIGVEYLFARYRKQGRFYQFNSTIVNLSVGVAERLLDTFTVGLFYFVYTYLHRHFALVEIRPGLFLWIALFVATDFVWYWYHRLGHEVSLFWSVHIVHHQSEDFNYTVSARITVFQAMLRTAFWSVLPIIGFPPGMITTVLLIHGAYPFFIHTRLVGKLGILEYIFVTPSHHRVHHACNEPYLDKNYGDVLIIWDKLFGTFAEETEEPRYGLTHPLESHSFLWQHFHFLLEVWHTARHTPGWRNKLKIVFGKPEQIAPETRQLLEKRYLFAQKNATPATRRFRTYVVWQMVVTLAVLFLFLFFETHLPLALRTGAALFILVTLVNCGAILEQRTWVFYLEVIRLLILIVATCVYTTDYTVLWTLGGITLLGVAFFNTLQKRYLQLVYA